jgi:hypothetical protein
VSAPPERLDPWLRHVRSFADEVVLSVDAAAGPEVLEVARRYADDVAVVELDGLPNRAYGWTAERTTGDWILALDDDELLTESLIGRLPGLLEGNVTHYHVPVRWLVHRPPEGLAWIRQFPWYPNHATRLFRNLAGCFRHPPELHGVWQIAGEGRALPADGDEAIYHLNLALLDRPERERKIAGRYRRLAAGGRPTCEEYYLYEDYGDVELVPVTEEAPLTLLPDRAGRPATRSRPITPAEATVPIASVETLRAHELDRAPEPPIWSAAYLSHDTPTVLGTNRGALATLRVRNTSEATWQSRGDVAGRVVISYRWRAADGSFAVAQGDVTLLPAAVPPGGEAEVVAGLWTPAEPGPYRLEWDMLCERVSWFSDRGVPPLVHEVDVRDLGVRPRASHFAPPEDDGRARRPRNRRVRHPALEAVRRALSAE